MPRLVFINFMIAEFADALTTHIGLQQPTLHEANGLGIWLLHAYGESGLFLVKLISVLLATYLLVRFAQKYPGMWIAIRYVTYVLAITAAFNLLQYGAHAG